MANLKKMIMANVTMDDDFHTCGEIIMSAKRNIFALCCKYCSKRFAAFPAFIKHLQGQHANEFKCDKDEEDGGEIEVGIQNIVAKEVTNEIVEAEVTLIDNLVNNNGLENVSILKALQDCDVSFNFMNNLNDTKCGEEVKEAADNTSKKGNLFLEEMRSDGDGSHGDGREIENLNENLVGAADSDLSKDFECDSSIIGDSFMTSTRIEDSKDNSLNSNKADLKDLLQGLDDLEDLDNLLENMDQTLVEQPLINLSNNENYTKDNRTPKKSPENSFKTKNLPVNLGVSFKDVLKLQLNENIDCPNDQEFELQLKNLQNGLNEETNRENLEKMENFTEENIPTPTLKALQEALESDDINLLSFGGGGAEEKSEPPLSQDLQDLLALELMEEEVVMENKKDDQNNKIVEKEKEASLINHDFLQNSTKSEQFNVMGNISNKSNKVFIQSCIIIKQADVFTKQNLDLNNVFYNNSESGISSPKCLETKLPEKIAENQVNLKTNLRLQETALEETIHGECNYKNKPKGEDISFQKTKTPKKSEVKQINLNMSKKIRKVIAKGLSQEKLKQKDQIFKNKHENETFANEVLETKILKNSKEKPKSLKTTTRVRKTPIKDKLLEKSNLGMNILSDMETDAMLKEKPDNKTCSQICLKTKTPKKTKKTTTRLKKMPSKEIPRKKSNLETYILKDVEETSTLKTLKHKTPIKSNLKTFFEETPPKETNLAIEILKDGDETAAFIDLKHKTPNKLYPQMLFKEILQDKPDPVTKIVTENNTSAPKSLETKNSNTKPENSKTNTIQRKTSPKEISADKINLGIDILKAEFDTLMPKTIFKEILQEKPNPVTEIVKNIDMHENKTSAPKCLETKTPKKSKEKPEILKANVIPRNISLKEIPALKINLEIDIHKDKYEQESLNPKTPKTAREKQEHFITKTATTLQNSSFEESQEDLNPKTRKSQENLKITSNLRKTPFKEVSRETPENSKTNLRKRKTPLNENPTEKSDLAIDVLNDKDQALTLEVLNPKTPRKSQEKQDNLITTLKPGKSPPKEIPKETPENSKTYLRQRKTPLNENPTKKSDLGIDILKDKDDTLTLEVLNPKTPRKSQEKQEDLKSTSRLRKTPFKETSKETSVNSKTNTRQRKKPLIENPNEKSNFGLDTLKSNNETLTQKSLQPKTPRKSQEKQENLKAKLRKMPFKETSKETQNLEIDIDETPAQTFSAKTPKKSNNKQENLKQLKTPFKETSTDFKQNLEKEKFTPFPSFVNTKRGDGTPLKYQDLFLQQNLNKKENSLEKIELATDEFSFETKEKLFLYKSSQEEEKIEKSLKTTPKSPEKNEALSNTKTFKTPERPRGRPPKAKRKERTLNQSKLSIDQQICKTSQNPFDGNASITPPGKIRKLSIKLPRLTPDKLQEMFNTPKTSRIEQNFNIIRETTNLTKSLKEPKQFKQISKNNIKTNSSLSLVRKNKTPIDLKPTASKSINISKSKPPPNPYKLDYKTYAINRTARKNDILQIFKSIKNYEQTENINLQQQKNTENISILPNYQQDLLSSLVQPYDIVKNPIEQNSNTSPNLNDDEKQTEISLQNPTTITDDEKLKRNSLKRPNTSPLEGVVAKPMKRKRRFLSLNDKSSDETKNVSSGNENKVMETSKESTTQQQDFGQLMKRSKRAYSLHDKKYLEMEMEAADMDGTNLLDDLLQQVVNEQQINKESTTPKKVLSYGHTNEVTAQELTNDLNLLNKVGLQIIKRPLLEDTTPLKEINEMREKAKKFAGILQKHKKIWFCVSGNTQELVKNYQQLLIETNQILNLELNMCDIRRLVNLIMFWYTQRRNIRPNDISTNSVAINSFLLIFGFMPKRSKYFCEYCDEYLLTDHKYFTHRLCHTNDIYPYRCPQCLTGFKNLKSYVTHEQQCITFMKQRLPGSNSKNLIQPTTNCQIKPLKDFSSVAHFKCPVCSEMFEKSNQLYDHTKTHLKSYYNQNFSK